MTIRWLKTSDGRHVPFDPRRLAQSIEAAARAAGEAADILPVELAEVVALVLERDFRERIPTTAEVGELVTRVLLETNHPRAAAAYTEVVKRRAELRAEIVVVHDATPQSSPDMDLPPASLGEPWRLGRIVEALTHRCRLDANLAEEVAAAVEAKVFSLGWKQVPAALVREVVDGELSHRGFNARLGRPGEVAVTAEELRAILVHSYVRRAATAEPTPGGPEAAVGVHLLTRFALDEIYPEEVAEASRAGRIHIQDVGRPLRLSSGALSIEAFKLAGPSTPGGAAPASAGELGRRVARAVADAARHHARAIGIPWVNVFLSPFVQGREVAVRRELCDFVRALSSLASGPTTGGPSLLLHLGRIPAPLLARQAVGARGRRWKTAYGELASEADRAARMLIEIIAEERQNGAPALVVEVGCEADLSYIDDTIDLAIAAPGLEAQASRGLAGDLDLAAVASPVLAGAAQIVGVNCAAAAYRAGRGDEPAFRRELDRAVDLGIRAIESKRAYLSTVLYRPDLPLWSGVRGAPAADLPPIVEVARAVHVLALVGLEEAYVFLVGETPAQNPAVAGLARAAISGLRERLRAESAQRGITIRLEEPDLERAARRLADLDLQSTPAAKEVIGFDHAAGSGEIRYSSGFGGRATAFDALYRAAGIAPYLPAGPGQRGKAAEMLAAAMAAAPAKAASVVAPSPSDGNGK